MPLAEVTREGREGFEIYTLILCFVAGGPVLFGGARPGTIQSLLPPDWQIVWGLTLTLGALSALVGIFWPQRATGLIVEQVGMVATGVAAMIYSVVALGVVGWTALLPSAMIGGFAVACFRRWFRIQRALKKAEALAARRKEVGGA